MFSFFLSCSSEEQLQDIGVEARENFGTLLSAP
jgi:hypothetical protein